MPEQRTQDGAIKAPPTIRETLGNMLKDIRLEPSARGLGVEGRVGPVEYRVMKNLGQPLSAGARVRVGPTEWDIDPTAKEMRFSGEVGPIAVRVQKTLKQPMSAEATVQVGQGTVRVGRNESGRFIHVNQRVRGADIDAGYDAQRGAYVSGKKSVGWGNR